MTGYLEDLEEKRNRLNREAEAHRKKRDRLNQETKRHAERRDQLNSEVKKLLQEANRFREKRDELNMKVKEEKGNRDVLTKEYTELKAGLDKLKKSRISSNDEMSIAKIKREIHGLEFKQQTSVMEPDKERGMVERIKHLKRTVKEKEKEMEANEDFRELLQKVREAKKKMDGSHQKVNEYADLAQKEHDNMIEHFGRSDKIRKEADQSQELFVQSKMKADDEHRKHIEMIHLVHDFDKILFGLREKKRTVDKKAPKAAGPAPGPSSAKLEAEKIYEKFKKGDKISTEDLMLLQKYGFL
ncbi:MAG: coiled-coil protein [Thermoplasmatota archaeon]